MNNKKITDLWYRIMLMFGATGRREFDLRKTNMEEVSKLLGFPPRTGRAKETAFQRRQRPLTTGRRKPDAYDLHAFRGMYLSYVLIYNIQHDQYLSSAGEMAPSMKDATVFTLDNAIAVVESANKESPALAMIPIASIPLQIEDGEWVHKKPAEMRKFLKLIKG